MTRQIQDTRWALEILRRAIGIEQEGRKFYAEAAKATQDKRGKEIFSTLASDELNHYNLLKSQYDSLKEQGDWVVSPEVQKVSIDLAKPLFPRGLDALKKKVPAKSSDMDALLFGLDIETKTYDLYRKSAVEVGDTLGKHIFEFLAEQEMGHFNMLMIRYEALFGSTGWWD